MLTFSVLNLCTYQLFIDPTLCSDRNIYTILPHEIIDDRIAAVFISALIESNSIIIQLAAVSQDFHCLVYGLFRFRILCRNKRLILCFTLRRLFHTLLMLIFRISLSGFPHLTFQFRRNVLDKLDLGISEMILLFQSGFDSCHVVFQTIHALASDLLHNFINGIIRSDAADPNTNGDSIINCVHITMIIVFFFNGFSTINAACDKLHGLVLIKGFGLICVISNDSEGFKRRSQIFHSHILKHRFILPYFFVTVIS